MIGVPVCHKTSGKESNLKIIVKKHNFIYAALGLSFSDHFYYRFILCDVMRQQNDLYFFF